MSKKNSRKKTDIDRNNLASELAKNKRQDKADALAYSKGDSSLRWKEKSR